MGNVTKLAPVSNDGAEDIAFQEPYAVSFTIEGVVPILFHRWSVEAVAEKAAAAKGSKSKKTDNVESYVYRNAENELCIPGEYVRMAMVMASKFRQDPRSPRKSAMDLYKAGLVPLTEYASLGKTTWDFLDQRRVMVQRSGITRVRPAMLAGWKATFEFQVQTPEYIRKTDFQDVLMSAGRLIGVGDFRPTYGRFNVTEFSALGG